MIRLNLIFVITCVFLFAGAAVAQDQEPAIRFNRIGVDDGLSQGSVRGLAADSTGFVWIGTQDGLNRFDGYDFKIYRHDPRDPGSLSQNWVHSVYIDHRNRVWAGTAGGLNLLDHEQDRFKRFFSDEQSVGQAGRRAIYDVAYLDDHNVFAAAADSLLRFSLQSKRLLVIHPVGINHQKRPDLRYYDLYDDHEGIVWVGTSWGLFRFSQPTNALVFAGAPRSLLPVLAVRAICEIPSDSGSLYLATGSGLWKFGKDSGRFTQMVPENTTAAVSKQPFIFIQPDQHDRFWLGSSGDGLFRFDGASNRLHHFVHDPQDDFSISYDFTMAATRDRAGGIWVGALNGVNRIPEIDNPFRIYRRMPDGRGLASNFVNAVAEDAAGRLWFGTFGHGITIFDPEKQHYVHRKLPKSLKPGKNSNRIWTLHRDATGNMWVGGDGGLAIYNAPQDRFVWHSELLHNARGELLAGSVMTIRDDPERLHISAGNHLYTFALQRECNRHRFPACLSLENKFALRGNLEDYVEDTRGSSWAGGTAGLWQLGDDGKSGMIIIRDWSDSLSHRSVHSLIPRADGSIWVATSRGLNLINPNAGSVRVFDERDGLANAYVYSLLQDDQNRLWLSSNRGLSMMAFKDDRQPSILNFSRLDGLSGNEFNRGAGFRAAGGRLFFGGTDGVTAFDPSRVQHNQNKPQIVLTGLRIFDIPADLSAPAEDIRKVELEAHQNTLTFTFSALSYSHGEKNRYAYFLEGVDPTWVEAGHRRRVRYTNLAPGRYRLHARAANYHGIWQDSTMTIDIVLHPPFWQTSWFWAFMIISALGILGLAYRLRIMALKRAQVRQEAYSRQLLEVQDEERQRLARDLHDGLGHMLLLLKNGLRRLSQENGAQKQQGEVIEQLTGTAADAIKDVRALSHSLHPHLLEKLGLHKALSAILTRSRESGSFTVDAHLDRVDDLLAPGQQLHVFRVVQEAMQNIIKYAQASEVKVYLIDQGAYLSVRIEDNGCGMTLVNGLPAGASDSLGLQSMHERVRILGGALEMNSAPGQGMQLEFRIPIGQHGHERLSEKSDE